MKNYIFLFLLLPMTVVSQTWHEDAVSSINGYLNNAGIVQIKTCDFMNACNGLELDTSATNTWQIGRPQKPYFDTAYIETQSILTDTINPYPVGNVSQFIMDMHDYTRLGCGFFYAISFMHKIDSDTLMDGGYIEASFDEGISWVSIFDEDSLPNWAFPIVYRHNLYNETDTLFNGTPGFSGKHDWREAGFLIGDYFGDCDSDLLIRFTFISDSIDNPRDGWMIDSLEIIKYLVGWSVPQHGKDEFNTVLYPNPAHNGFTVSIVNYNHQPYDVYILDATGREVANYDNIQQSDYKFSRNGLQNGIYHVVLSQKGLIMAREKVVID
jgi:hypothetical protein